MPECVVWIVLAALLGMAIGATICFFLKRHYDQVDLASARNRADSVISQAQKEAENIRKEVELQAKDELYKGREELNREIEKARNEQRETERRLTKREDNLEKEQQEVVRRERVVNQQEKKLADKEDQVSKRLCEADAIVKDQLEKLHDICGLDKDTAERLLLERLDKELSDEFASRLQKHEEHLRSNAEDKSREILASTIQRYAAEHTADTTVSTVDIPSDDMKGRIIGREGRNIRTFEKATGVDVIVDDTPGVVIVSAFDNIRRETAKLALSRLIQDGRIHPSRIEEVVKETQEEMERYVLDVGKQTAVEANVGHLHEKLLQLLGRLRFRTSYSQNVLKHSLEVSHLCGLMAEELGLHGKIARRCGLLHDIGKAADHEMEGGHPKVGMELAKRYGETNKHVLHAIVGHHDDVTTENIYTVLVAAADAISAARPGARRETLEKYVKRLEELEALAGGFPGIDHAYAIQAGRELRVIAAAKALSDSEALKTCREIAKAIEDQLTYPGEIKVTVLRETRAIQVAR